MLLCTVILFYVILCPQFHTSQSRVPPAHYTTWPLTVPVEWALHPGLNTSVSVTGFTASTAVTQSGESPMLIQAMSMDSWLARISSQRLTVQLSNFSQLTTLQLLMSVSLSGLRAMMSQSNWWGNAGNGTRNVHTKVLWCVQFLALQVQLTFLSSSSNWPPFPLCGSMLFHLLFIFLSLFRGLVCFGLGNKKKKRTNLVLTTGTPMLLTLTCRRHL